MCCPVGFSEEFIAVFWVEMSQIDTEKDKKFSNFKDFMRFLEKFRQSSWIRII